MLLAAVPSLVYCQAAAREAPPPPASRLARLSTGGEAAYRVGRGRAGPELGGARFHGMLDCVRQSVVRRGSRCSFARAKGSKRASFRRYSQQYSCYETKLRLWHVDFAPGLYT